MRCSHTDHACYPSTPWQLTVIQWGVHMLITRVILMMIDVVMHGQGQVTWRTTIFFIIKLFCRSFCIWTCLDYGHMEHYGTNAQNTYRRIHNSYCLRPVHTKRCYWAVILERIESRTVFFVCNVIILSIVYAIFLSQAAQADASRKNQRLIHERVTRCVTRY